MTEFELIKEGLRKINRMMTLFNRKFEYPGYTFNELSILGTVFRHPGIIARDICGYNVIDRGYLSKILKKLEHNGLILRTAEKRPPFEKALSVTPLGKKVYSEAELLVDRNIMTFLSALSDSEQEAFYGCLSEMAGYLRKIVPDIPEYREDTKKGDS